MPLFNFLFEVPLFLGLIIFVSIVVSLGMLIYFLAYRLMASTLTKEHERAGRTLFRTSAGLLALILSFTFANDRVLYYQIKDSLISEATQLVDMYMDLREYGTPEAEKINLEILSYIDSVVEDGWVPVQGKPFAVGSLTEFRNIYRGINDLEPTTEKQRNLLRNLLVDLDGLSDNMQVRVYQTNNDIEYVLYILLFGLIVIMMLFGVYKPDKVKVLFLSLYSGFIATIVFFMLIMSQPMKGPLQIKPEPFIILKEAIDSRQ